MGCSNCFNGCADIISDKCVKYTGVDIPELEILTGDPLLVVEEKVTAKILEIITGEGINPIILPEDLCSLINGFLTITTDTNINDVISATFKSICNLDSRLVITEGDLATLNADYIVDCLTGVINSSGTHNILQATINKLCSINTTLTALGAELVANYVLIADIDSYIGAYIAGQPSSTLYNSKMIPYVAVPYFGPTAGIFDVTGAGLGDWDKIYLCNGQNLTPDLRGRTLVGNTTMGATAFNPAVDPAILGNPTYTQNSTTGSNLVSLTNVNQIPLHSHPATVLINDQQHTHGFAPGSTCAIRGTGGPDAYSISDNTPTQEISQVQSSYTGLKGNGPGQNVFVTVEGTGQTPSEGHANIQPVLSTNFIIYIP